MREILYKKSGVDLFAVPGLGADTLLTVTSEVGFDMSPWKTVKHFTSWLSLCPGTRISGGKELKKRGKRKANRAAQAFRVGAATLGRSQSALGAFYRRIKDPPWWWTRSHSYCSQESPGSITRCSLRARHTLN